MSRDRETWEVTQRVGELTTRLSFAVELVDAYTEGRPLGSPTVGLAAQRVVAVENPSGYYLFLDLTTDPVDVVVDGGDRYFDERVTVYHSTSAPDDASAVEVTDRSTPIEVRLTPKPAFQFAPGTTTIRGTVVDDAGAPVVDAAVSLDGFAPTARTTATGEFALLVPATASDVVRDGDGKRVTDPTASTGGGSGDDSENGSSVSESGNGSSENGPPGNGPPGDGPGNGPPGNGPPNNGPPGNGPPDDGRGPNAASLPDPRLVVRHPDGSTVDTDLYVDAGRLTVLRIQFAGESITVDRLGIY